MEELLTIRVFGKGYGECIVANWAGLDGRMHCIVIDGFGWGNDSQWLKRCLDDDLVESVELVAVTHPHMDHVHDMGEIITACDWKRVREFWYWGGHETYKVRSHYAQIRHPKNPTSDARSTACQIVRLLDSMVEVDGRDPVPPKMGEWVPLQSLPSGQAVAIMAFSAPASVCINFRDQELDAHKKRGEGKPCNGPDANCVSLGLVLRFGDAHIMLAGDVENDNWEQAIAAAHLEDIKPNFIKVPHHASETGKHANMWKTGCGFFEHIAAHANATSVVTPWRNGDEKNHLPRKEVLNEIAASGHQVYVTASEIKKGELLHKNDKTPYPPHVKATVSVSGKVIVHKTPQSVKWLAPN